MNILKRLVFRGCLGLAAFMLGLVSQGWADTPQCPSGYMLEANGTQCARDLPPTCPAGFTWSSGVCQGTATAPSSCPEGMTYDASLPGGMCKSVVDRICPSGYLFSGNNKCLRLQDPNCPAGFHWSDPDKKCLIRGPAAPVCSSGSSYNAGKKVCEESVASSCAAGYTLRNGQCVRRTGHYQ